jgi:hypothetical protein
MKASQVVCTLPLLGLKVQSPYHGGHCMSVGAREEDAQACSAGPRTFGQVMLAGASASQAVTCGLRTFIVYSDSFAASCSHCVNVWSAASIRLCM